jgi:hypothetical protein
LKNVELRGDGIYMLTNMDGEVMIIFLLPDHGRGQVWQGQGLDV